MSIACCHADVRPESFLYFVGARGSGKSTLLNRFLYPDKACTSFGSCTHVCRLGHLPSQANAVLAHVGLHQRAAGLAAYGATATLSIHMPASCNHPG